MKLETVHLSNYRCHQDLKVDFRPGFNVVVGINGSGKTSLLKAIYAVLTGFTDFLSVPCGESLNESGIAFLQMNDSNGRIRFEPHYPITVHASAEAFATGFYWSILKVDELQRSNLTGNTPGGFWHAITQQSSRAGDNRSSSINLPILAFYRANRHWTQAKPNEMQAATQRNARTDGYANWWDAALDSAALQAWVIGKCLERFQTSSESGALFDQIQGDELALVNGALALAVEDAKGLRYDLKQKRLLMEWVDTGNAPRDPTAFENLSDGQRAVISLVADIARRMCLLNPQLGQEVTAQTPGVVLIDELDMHLHPHWQRIVVGGLKSAFPAVQFIATSHSPQVLGELHPDEIILLRPQGAAHPQVSYGLDSSRVLEEIMDAEARTPNVDKCLAELFATLERNELDISRQKLEELKQMAPDIPELAGAEALLKRKELLGR